jgi:hypothetical protein
MESTLHRQLKDRYGRAPGGRTEVRVGDYRADAIDPDGRLIEVQAGPLSLLRPKLARLLEAHEVRVIKPIVIERRIVRRDRAEGPDRSARRSPKRGELLDVFDDLVGLARVFPHPNLAIEVVGVGIDEVRVERRRGYRVIDRRLVEVIAAATLRTADDLWSLLPVGLDGPFTTLDCALKLGRPVDFAQRVAYCLRHAGAVEERGFLRRRRVYQRPASTRPGPAVAAS